MTDPLPAPPPPPGPPASGPASAAPVGPAGAWAGFAVLLYGCLVTCTAAFAFAMTTGGGALAEAGRVELSRQARAEGAYDEVAELAESLGELPGLLRESLGPTAWTGVPVGLLLLVSGGLLIAGRRGSRGLCAALLGLQVVRVSALAIHTIVVASPRFVDWHGRFVAAAEEIGRRTGQPVQPMPGLPNSVWLSATSTCATEALNFAVIGLLLWLVLRAPTRRWVEARSRPRRTPGAA